ncbi:MULTISPECIES: hypothetical protein [Paenibacillus]|uniref:Uncharacterized protein n=1 Tax=Paenibacillus odorifer TaxID=189426 RepID=A0A1R0WYQ8_9BACL|nr:MULTISPECIES: hypothetical protein [Paenibacillus]AIQ75352.1 hypothetical protein PODO_19935 [Paenibacillus odorifer]AWV34661.1 hypothetical protein CD191_19695 [Paenibacillus odorifer]ETT49956.1 hypothetical protein C171_23048 [Paenibacillus sp. FSL H8-237]OMC97901.1 hypothetical protein BJP46_24570 [Paenibacillus odorifer]OMD02897.1 hypothetical protein BJP49_25185 [Paenibacillus odorifer]
MRNKQSIVFVTIPLSEIKKFILIDIVAGWVFYFAIKFPFHSLIAASAGSMFGPILIRQSMKLVQNRAKV